VANRRGRGDEFVTAMSPGPGRPGVPGVPPADPPGGAGRESVKRQTSFTEAGLKRRFRPIEFLAERFVSTVAMTSLAAIVLIFVFVFREAAPLLFGKTPDEAQAPAGAVAEQETYGEEFLGEANSALDQNRKHSGSVETSGGEGEATVGNLLSQSWQPVGAEPKYGLLPLIAGSFKVTVIAILLAAPLAILAALFTSSFAPRWAKEILKPAIEMLAGFPSVVIGFFALVTLASLLQDAFGFEYRLNALVGGMAMALAVIPIIYTVAEDALAVVPRYMTEASLALGATKWQTALFVTLPAATPGVFAALLLGFGRALGETMIVLMATGNAALMDWMITRPVRTMSATIGAEMAEVVFGDTHYHVLFMIGAVLFVFTFILNAVAEGYLRQRLLRRFRGEAA
jgi:phosphate transport system permease protein